MLCRPDIGYLPTPIEVVNAIFELIQVSPNEVIYDLGSGDGRILIEAAQRCGARGVGIDIDGDRVQEAKRNAQVANVADRVRFEQGNLYDSCFHDATIVIIYLLPHLNLKLRPMLFQQLQPGTRVISHDFDMGDWQPEQIRQVPIPEGVATLYSWTIPTQIPPHLR